jgi:DNA-directed RNA polymerase II subunit RPB7
VRACVRGRERLTEATRRSGVIDNSNGSVVFKVGYEAVLFRPFPEEVVDTSVVTVTPLGFFAAVGPFEVFVTRTQFGPYAGHFDNARMAWMSDDGQTEIKAGCGVRLRIKSVRFEGTKISAVGTMEDHYCGVIMAG